MGALIITQVAAAAGVLVGFWAMLEHFDKRNEARFRALAKRIDEFNDALRREIECFDRDESAPRGIQRRNSKPAHGHT